MSVIYFCPKCNGEDVRVHDVKRPEIRRVSMDVMHEDSEMQRSMLHTSRSVEVRAVCGHCGYVVGWRETR